jgi:molybdopterin converting factor small subunit
VRVRIPAQIRRLYGTLANEVVPATEALTVAQLVAALDRRYPGIGERLTEPDGHMRRWVNVYVDGQDVREVGGAAATLPPGAEVIFVPSIAGG